MSNIANVHNQQFTNKIQFSDWPKCALRLYINVFPRLLLDKMPLFLIVRQTGCRVLQLQLHFYRLQSDRLWTVSTVKSFLLSEHFT